MRVEPARKGHPRGPLAFVVVGAFSLCFFAVQADSERFGTCLHYGWVEVVVKVVKVVIQTSANQTHPYRRIINVTSKLPS
jgi:hypothetical protein